MKIGLIAVDTKNFPNLPLMKLSAWHKARGDEVELFHDHSLKEADRIYMSKIFTFTPDYPHAVYAKEIVKGGTGYFYPDGGPPLPDEVEHMMPDYSLYGEGKAYGFLTRGCPRMCGFCIVSKKEGSKSVKVADLPEFWDGQKEIVLLDPNLLAYEGHHDLLRSLADTGAAVDFTQGLDVRLTDRENTDLLKRIKIGRIHLAWDDYGEKDLVVPKLEEFKRRMGRVRGRMIVYILCNYGTTLAQDLERIYTVHELGYFPYVMVYERHRLPKDHELLRIKGWANSHTTFARCPDYGKYLAHMDAEKGKAVARMRELL